MGCTVQATQPVAAPTATSSPSSSLPQDALGASKLTARAFGPVQIGMTVQEATQAAGMPLVTLQGGTPELDQICSYVRLQNAPEGFQFMLNRDRIVRIDVRSQNISGVAGRTTPADPNLEVKRIATPEGAALGSSEAEILALYPGQIEVTNHKYVSGGHYLTFTPKDAADANYRLIFETDGDRVTYIRAGQQPEVEWVEGCS
ncbi:hypothetical protein IFO70_09720 [Phormidium tenue FACHB-886]|nr:hypothetical protein [Phormidium tenue FACHB-886]